MADTTQATISEKGHAPDKSETTGAHHCEHCADHHARLSAVEAKLGMAAQPGVAKEETAAKREPSYGRKRH